MAVRKIQEMGSKRDSLRVDNPTPVSGEWKRSVECRLRSSVPSRDSRPILDQLLEVEKRSQCALTALASGHWGRHQDVAPSRLLTLNFWLFLGACGGLFVSCPQSTRESLEQKRSACFRVLTSVLSRSSRGTRSKSSGALKSLAHRF